MNYEEELLWLLLEELLDTVDNAIASGDWTVDGACDPTLVVEALRSRLPIDAQAIIVDGDPECVKYEVKE